MDLYNWYVKSGLLCGDLCVRTGFETKYRDYKEFKKMQKTLDKLRDPERVHVYVEAKILGKSTDDPNVVVVRSASHGDLHLVNMDNYFYSNDARRSAQFEKLNRR